jgi:hypothetical protein
MKASYNTESHREGTEVHRDKINLCGSLCHSFVVLCVTTQYKYENR